MIEILTLRNGVILPAFVWCDNFFQVFSSSKCVVVLFKLSFKKSVGLIVRVSQANVVYFCHFFVRMVTRTYFLKDSAASCSTICSSSAAEVPLPVMMKRSQASHLAPAVRRFTVIIYDVYAFIPFKIVVNRYFCS